MILTVRSIILALLLTLAGVLPVCAELSGYMAWNYADYSHDVDGVGKVESSAFFQQYSLLYSTAGLFNDGRAGKWSGSLGYEWNSLSTDYDNENSSVDTGKILYSGQFLFAPGGLPLRFSAFSYDLNRSTMYSGYYPASDYLIYPDIASGIFNGQHVVSGFTMLAGIRNGSYLGEYRELLSQFPKLLVDFRETYVRDIKRFEPEHYRLRDLAFVSLNKKDNWFHYRYTDYTDFEDPSNDYEEKTYLIGTIDHLQRRQWVNLTNWVKISVDGSLTQWWNSDDGVREDYYTLNAFTMARRNSWNFANFTNMSRSNSSDGELRRSFEFPLYAQGVLDPNTSWRLQFLGRSEEDTFNQGFANEHSNDESNLYAQYDVATTRRTGFVITPGIELENKSGSRGEGKAGRLSLEWQTDRRYRRPLNWLIDYEVGYLDGKSVEGESSSYFEQTGTLSVDYRPNARVAMGATERLTVGLGDLYPGSTNYIQARGWEAFTANSHTERDSDALEGTTLVSITSAFLEFNDLENMRNRFAAELDYFDSDGYREHRIDLTHILTYEKREINLKAATSIQEGDNLRLLGGSTEYVGSLYQWIGVPDQLFSHRTQLRYMPSRFWQARSMLGYDWANGKDGDAQLLTFKQDADYYLYRVNGLARKLAMFGGRFEYDRLWGNDSVWYSDFRAVSEYYPSPVTAFGADVEIQYYGLTDQVEIGYGLYAELNYPKFQARASYQYAQRQEGDFLPSIHDQRWEISAKKLF